MNVVGTRRKCPERYTKYGLNPGFSLIFILQIYSRLGVGDILQHKFLAILVGAIAVTIPTIFLWRRISWRKSLLVIVAIASIDLDHFFFTNQAGFLQVPKQGVKILHAFHTIEFLLLMLFINLLDIKRGRSWEAWFFPQERDYDKIWWYYLAWTTRILLFGLTLHYFMDFFIYTIMGKWGFYDLSVIHYLLHN
ncbi:hypothetical protein ACHOLT_11790 [Desulfitobacterium sp. Sab5]|uniref:hypothetical protein n=1 Tax=Desulfitobacterium nosdiversum TaxID=3375356 RepID=UPI003CEB4DE3